MSNLFSFRNTIYSVLSGLLATISIARAEMPHGCHLNQEPKFAITACTIGLNAKQKLTPVEIALTYQSRAVAYALLKDTSNAIKDLTEAARLASTLPEGFPKHSLPYYIAKTYRLFDKQRALFLEDQLVDSWQGNGRKSEAVIDRGITKVLLGDENGAQSDADLAVSLMDSIYSRLFRGGLLLARGRYQDAQNDFSYVYEKVSHTSESANHLLLGEAASWLYISQLRGGEGEKPTTANIELAATNDKSRLPEVYKLFLGQITVEKAVSDILSSNPYDMFDKRCTELPFLIEWLVLSKNIASAKRYYQEIPEKCLTNTGDDRDLSIALSELHSQTSAVLASPINTPPTSASLTPTPAGSSSAPTQPTIAQGRRVALVIGNSIYTNVGKLPNPNRDADAVAASLRSAGFQTVTVKVDLSRSGMIAALNDFSDRAANADWAMIYFSGHGLEVDGINYIVPVDAKLLADRDVGDEAIALDRLLKATLGARKLHLLILDACRDDPFVSNMKRTVASRSIGRGLARVEPEGGTLVVYAAKDGQIAYDGDGQNSPFVTALTKRIAEPNLEINMLFRQVRDDVLAATSKKQEPYVYGSLPGENFYFVQR